MQGQPQTHLVLLYSSVYTKTITNTAVKLTWRQNIIKALSNRLDKLQSVICDRKIENVSYLTVNFIDTVKYKTKILKVVFVYAVNYKTLK